MVTAVLFVAPPQGIVYSSSAREHRVPSYDVCPHSTSRVLLFFRIQGILARKESTNRFTLVATRTENEQKSEHWIDHEDGTRTYWYEVQGKHGWRARYLKLVDSNERTLGFRQEVYNEKGDLVEIHEKYPVDKGHTKLRE